MSEEATKDDGRSEGRSAVSETSTDQSPALDDVPDGAGCTEIWERLSERRHEEE